MIFQSRGPGADLRWSPGDDLMALPRCDAVLALWGETSVAADDADANAQLAQISRQVAQACGAGRVFHMSSAAVYGPGQALREDDPAQPANPYGHSKLAMEKRVAGWQTTDADLRHCLLRVANVVGADSLAPALRDMAGPATLDRFADGAGPRRSYLAASDLLRLLAALMDLPDARLPGVLNVAAPRPVEMEALLQAAGKRVIWRPAPPTALQDVTLDAGALQKLVPGLAFLNNANDLIRDWTDLEAAQ